MRAPHAQSKIPPPLPPIAGGTIALFATVSLIAHVSLFATASLIAHVLVSTFGPYGIHRDAAGVLAHDSRGELIDG